MASVNAQRAKKLEKSLARLSEIDIATVLVLCFDHRNHALAHHQIDFFECPKLNHAKKQNFADAAKEFWIYSGSQPQNETTELARRVFMITVARRDDRVSKVWKQLIRGQSFAHEAARNWEQNHNQLLRIDNIFLLPKGLDPAV